MSLTLSALVSESRRRLESGGCADPATDARMLIAGTLGLSQTDILLRADRPVTEAEAALVDAALERRLHREPVHRILGRREFFGLTLKISAETLEPRPDTEVLVEALVPYARSCVQRNGSARLLDLGTGTGAIALALLREVEGLTATGTDIARGALQTARENAENNGVADRFVSLESRWFDAVDGRFDIIVSNPPYIPGAVIAGLEPDVRDFDPMLALDGGDDGLDAYRSIADGIHDFLKEDGVIGLEIGYDQKQRVTDIFTVEGYALLRAVTDYGGNDRVLLFSRGKA